MREKCQKWELFNATPFVPSSVNQIKNKRIEQQYDEDGDKNVVDGANMLDGEQVGEQRVSGYELFIWKNAFFSRFPVKKILPVMCKCNKTRIFTFDSRKHRTSR
jgi:hypothetical protein